MFFRASRVPASAQKLATSNNECMAVTHVTELIAGEGVELARSTTGTGLAT